LGALLLLVKSDVITGTQGVCEYLLAQWQCLPQAWRTRRDPRGRGDAIR